MADLQTYQLWSSFRPTCLPSRAQVPKSACKNFEPKVGNVEALIVRLGFWGIVYNNCNKEPPKIIEVPIHAII